MHSDYGFNNLIVSDNKISGVVDWEHSKYGDFVFDVAWLEFWRKGSGFAKELKSHYEVTGRDVKNFEKRLLAYVFYFGIGAIGFFAKSKQPKGYKWTRDRLMEFAEEAEKPS